MLIAIDVGNSRIKLGLFGNSHGATPDQELPACLDSLAVEIDEAIPWSRLAEWKSHDSRPVQAVILGGVNPRGRDKVLDGWPVTGWPAPTVVDSPFVLPIEINVDSPRMVGVDRLLNAIAANVIRPAGKAVIIVDSGTATTVDVVSAQGTFEGGAILPGFQICSRALHQYAALLPLIPNQELDGEAPHALGKNTRDAIKSGLFWGQLGAVKELVQLLSQHLGGNPMVIVTGGAGRVLAPHMSSGVMHEPFFALQGLIIVGYEVMRSQNSH